MSFGSRYGAYYQNGTITNAIIGESWLANNRYGEQRKVSVEMWRLRGYSSNRRSSNDLNLSCYTVSIKAIKINTIPKESEGDARTLPDQ